MTVLEVEGNTFTFPFTTEPGPLLTTVRAGAVLLLPNVTLLPLPLQLLDTCVAVKAGTLPEV